MAQRWVTEKELMQMQNKFEQGGTLEQNPLQQFFEQLPPELQEKIQMLPPEKQQEVLMQLLDRYQQQGEQSAPQQQFALGGEAEEVPVEAERNETLTTQDGSIPNTEGGYLEKKSFNPISGQATYEIPDDEHSQTHPEGGVNMMLKEGDVVNSDKTKIPTDFKVYGKNFKGKSFKEASDFLSKKEEGIQKQLAELQKEGKADKVSENSVSIMLAKAAINRNELNELQEQVLESKKQKEYKDELNSSIKQFGGLVKNATKSEEVYNKTLDRFLNGYTTERPVLKAEKGLSASISKMQSFTDKISANPKMSTQDVMAAFKQSGLYNQPSESTAIYKPNFAPIKDGSKVVSNFKDMIASKESNAYKNPYIAMSGIDENTASKFTYSQLRPKAASSAIGKYQIVWDLHKNDIKKVTGVADPEVFRRNPKAQEDFMDWFRDNRLLPQATQVKQKYQVPMSIEQIMAGIHLEGMGSEKKKNGFIGKYLSGQLKESTMAGKFKNTSTSNYMQGFEHGGYIADGGFNFTTWQGDKMIKGRNAAQYSAKDLQDIASYYFPDKKYTSNKELQRDIITLLGDDYRNYVKPIPVGTKTGLNEPDSLIDDKFGDDWNLAINYLKPDPKTLPDIIFNTSAIDNGGIKTTARDITNDKELYSIPFYPGDESFDTPNIDKSQLNRTKSNQYVPSEEDKSDNSTTQESSQNKQSSWLDKLKYGMRESLPYLDAMRLMREGRIMPTLQQKSYQNPYDNLTTDINIQSALNDIDRQTLAGISDSTGNPSVRNARIAQLIANAQSAKSPLYTQKYNQEKQLENQKTLGQMQYYNQWEDVNRDLKKRYEQEVLQTIENQRQQKHMASNKMMNDYLRKQESDQARDLSLLETNYDWNPYTGKFEFNPEKAERNMAYKKATFSGKSSNSQVIEGEDGKQYEVITPKSGKPIVREIKKYGGKIKRK